MRRKTTFIYLTLFCLFAGIPVVWGGETIARQYKPTPSYAFCTAVNPIFNASDTEPKIYYSGVFYVSDSKFTPVQDSFIQFLEKNYSYPHPDGSVLQPVVCTSVNTMEMAQQTYDARMKDSYGKKRPGIIETDWKYAS